MIEIIKLNDNENVCCAPLPPPPIFPQFNETKLEKNSILEQMSLSTNTPINQIEHIIGDELQKAMGQMNQSEVLLTLKNALQNATDKQQQHEHKRIHKRKNKCLLNNSCDESTIKLQKLRYITYFIEIFFFSEPILKNNIQNKFDFSNDNYGGCEMEISSDKSEIDLTRSSNGANKRSFVDRVKVNCYNKILIKF